MLAAGQEFEVALPGTGSHFAPVPQGAFLSEGSEVRTGKNGWTILRFGNDTQVELRADSEMALSGIVRAGETQRDGARTDQTEWSDNASASHAWDRLGYVSKRQISADTPPDASAVVVEVKLRRGALAALADGTTELRVWFANSVTTAAHARFAVKAGEENRARVIVERGTTRIFVNDSKKAVSPTAGQSVEIDKLATGHVVTAVQPVRSNDTEAVAEMAALRFAPALAEPAVKALPTTTDNSTATQPTTANSTTQSATSTTSATSTSVTPTGASANQSTSTTAPTFPPTASVVQPGAVATTSYAVAPPSSSGNVDPLQAPANGANIKGPVTSPEHP